MTYAIRLSIFILLSIVLHCLVFNIEFSQQAVLQANTSFGVGYVSSSAENFVAEQIVKHEQVIDTFTPSETVGSALQESASAKALIERPTPQVLQPSAKTNSSSLLPELTSSTPKKIPDTAPGGLHVESRELEIRNVITPERVAAKVVRAGTELSEDLNREGAGLSSVAPIAEAILPFRNALPRYDFNPLPVYPDSARRRGQEGTVQLEVKVKADGRAAKVKLVSSSGFKSLDRAAQKAVRTWQFLPASYQGLAVESRVVVPVNFVLDE